MHVKRLFRIVFLLIFIPFIASADIASVQKVHNEIYNQKGVTVPVESGVDVNNVSSIHYLFQQIDRANEILNGEATTSYATTADAVYNPVGNVKVAADVDALIQQIPKFTLTVTDVSSFNFYISAAGNFTVDWGDGTIDTITKSDTTNTNYTHTYSATGNYNIIIDGAATAYNTNTAVAAITFGSSTDKTKITAINGSLTGAFSDIAGVSPRFYRAFYGCTGLTSIPETLFANISGAPVANMFYSTFQSCTALTSIPATLFSDISGAPAARMFQLTFYGCSGLTSIPSTLFSGLSGAPAIEVFNGTFQSCNNITSIPSNLFGGVSGAPAEAMFYNTFYGCTGLTSIPATLFSGITGAPAPTMFYGTFYNCTGLTGVPSGLFSGISGAPASFMFSDLFYGCTGLTSIPENLFSGISGTPAQTMFRRTFSGCSGLTGSVPANFFGTFTGAPAISMFQETFNGCLHLTGISDGMWNISGITNTSASQMFDGMFKNCSGITTASPSLSSTNSTKMYTYFTVYIPTSSSKPFTGCTGMTDYASIPTAWK